MKDESSGARPERYRSSFPRLQSSRGIREQSLQASDRILPVGIRTELRGVRSREKRGEAEERVRGEEAVLSGWGRVEQCVNEWMPAAKSDQRAGLAAAEDAELARLTQDQRLCSRHDVGVPAASAQQPSGDGRVEWLAHRFEGRGDRGKIACVPLVQTSQRMGAGEGTAGTNDAEWRNAGGADGSAQRIEVGRRRPLERLGQLRHLSRIWSGHR